MGECNFNLLTAANFRRYNFFVHTQMSGLKRPEERVLYHVKNARAFVQSANMCNTVTTTFA